MIPFRKLIETIAALAETAQQAELKQNLREVHNSLISASDSYMEMFEKNVQLLEENKELKDDFKKYQDWEKEKQEYEIHRTPYCIFYKRKGTNDLFCPTCFVVKQTPIPLQHLARYGMRVISCTHCGADFHGMSASQIVERTPVSEGDPWRQ